MTSIPEDIMEAARDAYRNSPIKVLGDIEAGSFINVIAQALLAERMKERERCAGRVARKADEARKRAKIYAEKLSGELTGRKKTAHWRGQHNHYERIALYYSKAEETILNNKGEER